MASTKFLLTSQFLGYSSRIDITNLPAGYMVKGSHDVLTNMGDRIACRRGIELDGQANPALTPILSSFDFENHLGYERNLRSYYDVLEYRYVDPVTGAITWNTLKAGWGALVNFQYTTFWDTTELMDVILFVNGSTNVYEWGMGLTTFASATANTITKQGTTTWAEEGFYAAKTGRAVVIDGTTYTYTGGEGTTTLTGVTPDPTAAPHTAGAVIMQAVVTTANSAITGLPAAIGNDLISGLYNQIHIGNRKNHTFYVSKVNNYKDFTFTTPVRKPGEGSLITLDFCPVVFIPQEDTMYVSAGKSAWYITAYTLTSDGVNETLNIKRLKSGLFGGAQSADFVTSDKNNVVFLSNEPVVTTLGRIELVEQPQTVDISDPIKKDMLDYDFTGGSMKYHQRYYYIAIPKNGTYIVYNIIKGYWEAPQTGAFSRFSIIGGELYGHSSVVPETYKLGVGGNDNGAPISAMAAFAYNNHGDRADNKSFNEFYNEGYISSNTKLNLGIMYEYKGADGQYSATIDGADLKYILDANSDGSLGN